jgi:hypothetical protein
MIELFQFIIITKQVKLHGWLYHHPRQYVATIIKLEKQAIAEFVSLTNDGW